MDPGHSSLYVGLSCKKIELTLDGKSCAGKWKANSDRYRSSTSQGSLESLCARIKGANL